MKQIEELASLSLMSNFMEQYKECPTEIPQICECIGYLTCIMDATTDHDIYQQAHDYMLLAITSLTLCLNEK